MRIANCRVLDVREGSLLEGRTIVIRDGIIERISRGGGAAHGEAETIEAEGRVVIPGLMNLHTHPQRRHAGLSGGMVPFRIGAAAVEDLPNTQRIVWAIRNTWFEMLEHGVTTFRAAGSKDCLNIELRDVFRKGVLGGPRVIASGAILATTGGHGTRGINGAMEVDGPDEMRKAVRALLKAGADWIKLCVSGGLAGIHKGDHPTIVEFSDEEIRTAVVEAHRRSRKVMVHGMASQSVRMAVEAGVDCIEHGNLLDDATVSLMKSHGVSFVPTMSGIRMVYEREKVGGDPAVAAALWEVISPHSEAVKKCIEAGVLIGTGTDTLGNVHDEIRMLASCGMTPARAIAAATRDSARVLGLENEIGAVEEGMKADLVVVDGDPTHDLECLSKIKEVIVGGRVADREFLTAR
ncbi:MAG: amidohydrolase family protein [Thermotogota bacterium]